MNDVLGDFIPDFRYLVVPLSKYTNQELVDKGDELSLIMLIDKLRNAADFQKLKDIPAEYFESISKNSPESVLKLIGKIISVLLLRMNVPKEEVADFTDRVERRDFTMLFENFETYDVQETRRISKAEGKAEFILELLEDFSHRTYLTVELGLQTIHASTAAYIRRGYPLSVYDEAMRALHARGISVITHQILGLPGETPEMMVETARYIGRSGADGIKLHLLHVLAGTDLAADYAAGKFGTLTLDAYITLLETCLRVLPREMVIHRLTGDGAKRDLLAPGWSGDKKRVINEIR